MAVSHWAPYKPHNSSLAAIFPSAKALEQACKNYFDACDSEIIKKVISKSGKELEIYTRPYTLSGLALHLGLGRTQLVKYSFHDVYGDVILWARTKCENYVEEGMLVGRLNVLAAMFNLKNNYGWKDKEDDKHRPLAIGDIDENSLKELSTDDLRKLVLAKGGRTIDLVLATPEGANSEGSGTPDTATVGVGDA